MQSRFFVRKGIITDQKSFDNLIDCRIRRVAYFVISEIQDIKPHCS